MRADGCPGSPDDNGERHGLNTAGANRIKRADG
jgi:hypothetical protein